MSKPINRRNLLRYSALAGAGALTSPLWAGAANVSAAIAQPAHPAGSRSAVDRAADRIVASVRRPRFPGRMFPVTRFGAAGDGTTRYTPAFAAAIAACHRAGGGRRVVPPGPFLTGAIHLLSDVDLHVGRARRILFSQDPERLPAGGVDPLAGHRADELLAAHLLLRPAQHRGHRAGHAQRPGRRQSLVELEEPCETPTSTCSRRWPTTASRSPSGCSAPGHFLPPQMIQPFRCRHRAHRGRHRSSTRRSGT